MSLCLTGLDCNRKLLLRILEKGLGLGMEGWQVAMALCAPA